MTPTEKTIVIADASLFKASSCLLRTFYTAVSGYRGRINNNDMEFGSAFHKFRSIFRATGHFGNAYNAAIAYFETTPMHVKSNKKYLNTGYLVRIMTAYAEQYKNDNFQLVRTDKAYGDIPSGTALVEPVTRFMFPYYVDDHCEILIAGTIDELGKWQGGIHCITDCKTTSCWNVDDYFRGYDLSPQLICYRWAWEQYANEYPDSFFAKIFEQDIGAFIDGVFYKGEKDFLFQRSNVITFKREQIEEFDLLVSLKVRELVAEITRWRLTGKIPPRYGMLNGACETQYGRCTFFNVCAAQDEIAREAMLEKYFIVQNYNPMHFGA